MKVDITRDTFRPQRHYSSVRLEQGRISVDADWNEQIAINHHHTRTTARDVIGTTGTPKHEPAFQIVLSPDGKDLLITPGRFYVDGILCELDTPGGAIASYGPGAKQAKVSTWVARALANGQWIAAAAPGQTTIYTQITAVDTTNGIVTFADEIKGLGSGATMQVMATYGTQPDLAVTLPSPLFSVGSAVVYLDVWERAITTLDDPQIREVALNGADTATRTKIVWQVKVLPLTEAGPLTCASSLPDYDAKIAAPTGRLTARAKRDVTTDNPCIVPTASGYRRLENQLYRVEIHTGGSMGDGKTTFVWSRDNGAVAARITGRVGDVLTLAAAPRDEALGFASGQWIEVTDDTSELAGVPGTLIRLTKAEGKQLTLDSSSGSLDLSKYPSNPKVRRWDSVGEVAVASDPSTDDGYLRLEDGVQVKFEAGTYRTGDYWLVPARTVTADVEWPSDANGPLSQPPKGIRHHYTRLAMATTALQGGANVTKLEDCRKLFPPLDDISADDVSVHCDCDLLAETKTVQEALDVLCHERDLRFHNQHLHGWGIVCGLQVQCGPDTVRETGTIHDVVTVNNGYAIDSLGNDIIVDVKDQNGVATGDQLAMLDMLRQAKLLIDPNDPNKLVDGSVSLKLRQGATAADRYQLELYDPSSNTWGNVFKQGFWWDVWTDCILPLIAAFKDEFFGASPETWEHVIAFINVLAQLIYPQNGPHVYISPEEDQILRDFYEKLRKLLQSKTFCAMFDGRAFPDYDLIFRPTDLEPRPSTIFGKVLLGFSLPSRMRITPSGSYAYTLSGKIVAKDQSSVIDIFDVEYDEPTTDNAGNPVFEHPGGSAEEWIGSTAFPTAGATVTDVAFSSDSTTMYAIAILNNNDSLFSAADLTDPTNIKWGPVTTLCDFPLVTLKLSLTDSTKLYAIGRGVGLFLIDTGGLQPNQTQINSFTATGHLEVAMIGVGNSRKAYAFCTVGATPTYDRVRRIDLTNPAGAPYEYLLPASNPQGNDDICVATEPKGKFFKLFAVANAGMNQISKQLIRFDASSGGATAPAAEAIIDLAFTPPNNNPGSTDNTVYRLAYNDIAQRVMIASMEAFLIKLVTPTSAALDQNTFPTQLWPIAIAFNPNTPFGELTGAVFVLNALSGTINNIPASYLANNPGVVDLAALATYHSKVLEAFIDLFGKFAQYLKDCVCEHFLIECPDDVLKPLYLARIDVKDQQVFNICNFSRRRYVHSFPTVEYWMSIVPVLPVVRKLIGDACCQIVQTYFSTVNAPDAAKKSDLIGASSAYNGLQVVQGFQLANVFTAQAMPKLNLAGALGKAFFAKSTAQPPPPAPPPAGNARLVDVANQPAKSATAYLADKHVTVLSKEVATGASIGGTLTAPATLQPNDNVVLVTDANDVVLGYRVVKPAAPAGAPPAATPPATSGSSAADKAALAHELGKRDTAIADLRKELDAMKTSHDEALAARDKKIEDLSKKVTKLSHAPK